MLTMLMVSLMCSIMFIFMFHPMSMGLMMMAQTVLISLVTGFFNVNFWYSYILFLIMVGGMLVLFMYMTSVASNEKFSLSAKLTATLGILVTTTVIVVMISDPLLTFVNNFKNTLMDGQIKYTLAFSKFLTYPTYMIMYLVIIYLLITLVAVVKITSIKMGPLRSSN